MQRLGIGAAIAAVAVIVIGMIAWLVLAPGWAIGALNVEAQKRLGHPVSVAGGAHLEFSPQLAIRFDDVAVKSAMASDEPLLKAASLRVPVSTGSLFSHDISFTLLRLSAADVLLEISEQGQSSWPAALAKPASDVRIEMEGARIRFVDRRHEQSFAVNRADLVVSLAASGEMTATGGAEINQQFAKLDAYLKDIDRVPRDGSPFEFTLDAPALKADFSGRLSTSKILALAGTFSLSGSDLREALRWAGAGIGGEAGFKEFSVAGALDSTGRTFALLNANVSVDDIKARGSLSLDARGEFPRVEAIVGTNPIDLSHYLGSPQRQPAEWGTTPIAFSNLRGLSGAFRLQAQDLIYGGYHMGPSLIDATLNGGELASQITPKGFQPFKVTLDGASAVPAVGFEMKSSNVDVGLLAKEMFGITWISGVGEVSTAFTASGHTEQEMVSNLRGSAKVSLASGSLNGVGIPALLSAVSNAIQTGWGEAKAQTAFQSLQTEMTLADGIATLKDFKLDGDRLAMTGAGEIDFLRKSVDLRVDPRLKTADTGETAGLPVAIVVRGPWANPRIFPDLADIDRDPKAAYDALKAQGLPLKPEASGNP